MYNFYDLVHYLETLLCHTEHCEAEDTGFLSSAAVLFNILRQLEQIQLRKLKQQRVKHRCLLGSAVGKWGTEK